MAMIKKFKLKNIWIANLNKA